MFTVTHFSERIAIVTEKLIFPILYLGLEYSSLAQIQRPVMIHVTPMMMVCSIFLTWYSSLHIYSLMETHHRHRIHFCGIDLSIDDLECNGYEGCP